MMDFAMWDGFIGLILLVAIPAAILQMVLMIAAIISLVRKPTPFDNEKILWLLLIVLVSTIGPIIYFVIGSAKLDEKAARMEDERRQQWEQQ